jgi:hypothetical protein
MTLKPQQVQSHWQLVGNIIAAAALCSAAKPMGQPLSAAQSCSLIRDGQIQAAPAVQPTTQSKNTAGREVTQEKHRAQAAGSACN